MTAKNYARLVAAIFAIVALLQLARAFYGWQITLHGNTVPVWPSWIASGVAVMLSWLGFTASRA